MGRQNLGEIANEDVFEVSALVPLGLRVVHPHAPRADAEGAQQPAQLLRRNRFPVTPRCPRALVVGGEPLDERLREDDGLALVVPAEVPPDVSEKLGSRRLVSAGITGAEREGGGACPHGPVAARHPRDREQRAPVVLRPIVELVEHRRVDRGEGAVVADPAENLAPERRLKLDQALAWELGDALVLASAAQRQDDRAILDGVELQRGERADQRERTPAPRREAARLVLVPLASNDEGQVGPATGG